MPTRSIRGFFFARSGCVYWRFDLLAATRSSVSIGSVANRPGHRYALYFSDWTKSAVAIDAETGEPLWRTKVDDSSGPQMTGAPTLYNGVAATRPSPRTTTMSAASSSAHWSRSTPIAAKSSGKPTRRTRSRSPIG